jgi:hypothetical protein
VDSSIRRLPQNAPACALRGADAPGPPVKAGVTETAALVTAAVVTAAVEAAQYRWLR